MRVQAAAVALTAVSLGVLFMDLTKATLRAMVDLGGVLVLGGIHMSVVCACVCVRARVCVCVCKVPWACSLV